jgi:predicted nucleic acid-binding protein
MTSSLVDTSIMLDLLVPGQKWHDWSQDVLAESRDDGDVVINPIVLAETAPEFDSEKNMIRTMEGFGFSLEDLPWSASYMAGVAHVEYRKSGGFRDRTLPDFLIGAHATVCGYRLLTRDPKRYRRHFPKLHIVSPDSRS